MRGKLSDSRITDYEFSKIFGLNWQDQPYTRMRDFIIIHNEIGSMESQKLNQQKYGNDNTTHT